MTPPPAVPPPLAPGRRFDTWRPGPPGLVVADVDGTLVGPQRHAADEVVAAIGRAQEAGVRVGFATGRMRLAVVDLLEQLRATGPHILHNGAEVRLDGRTVTSTPLTDAHVDAVLHLAAEHGWYAELYVEDGYLVTAEPEAAAAHWELLGHRPLGRASRETLAGRTVFKATFGVFDGDPGPVEAALEAHGVAHGTATSPRTPGIVYVNAVHPRAGKGHALRQAAEAVDLAPAAVVAVGDGRNDLAMLEVAGTAVAMADAPDEVRAAAHLVAPSVEDHGVAALLDACREWRRGASVSGPVERSG